MYQFHKISIYWLVINSPDHLFPTWSQWFDHFTFPNFLTIGSLGQDLAWEYLKNHRVTPKKLQEVSFKSWQFLFFVIVGFMYSSFRLGWLEMMMALDQYLWQWLKSGGHSNRSAWASLYCPKITQPTIPPFVILCSYSKPIQTSSCSQLVLLLVLGQKVAYSSQSVPNVSAR